MTLTQLEYVLAIDKHRHFGRAAAACFVTQPTLSMQLQKLEEELGATLFDRSKSPILPTAEGQIVIGHAQRIFSEVKALRERLSESGEELSGEFRLAIIPTLAPYLLPLFVDRFVNAHPKIELKVEEYKTEDIIQLLARDQIDAALAATPLNAEGLQEEVLFYEPFYVFASKNHPLFEKNRVKENELDANDVWLLNEGHCLRDQVIRVCSLARKKESLHRNLHFESGNLETLKNLVANGSGYTLLPHLALQNLAPLQRKMVREFAPPVPTREVSLIFSRTHYRRAIIEALKKAILSSVPEDLSRKKGKGLEVIALQGG